MLLAVLSAGVQYFVLQRIKAGNKAIWQIGGLIALALGLAAVAMQIYQLATLPFPPGSSGFSSVFVGFYAVFLIVQLAVLVWLEILLARSRYIPALSFVEQPPTYADTLRGATVPGVAERLLRRLELPGRDGPAVLAAVLRSLNAVSRRREGSGVNGVIADPAYGAWTFGASILSFAFPMLLFIVVASWLYVTYTKPELVPGHRNPTASARSSTPPSRVSRRRDDRERPSPRVASDLYSGSLRRCSGDAR